LQVYARGSSFHPELEQIGVKDHAVVMLHFASGVTATIELSRSSSYGYDQRMEVRGPSVDPLLLDLVRRDDSRGCQAGVRQ
jgi:predicted dehydrogenase